MRIEKRGREDYGHFQPITTRWMDNDAYGHVNNVVYYSWFDTVVNQYLVSHGVLDIAGSAAIGLVVETKCNYFSPLSFPGQVEVGLRVAEVGNSSVRYEIGIFAAGQTEPSAQGHFVHVYVDRVSRRPCPVPASIRTVISPLKA